MLDLYFKFILNDDDTYLGVEHDKRIVEGWIKNNYIIYGDLTISDDLVVDCNGSVNVKNKSITSLTNGLFRWGNVDRDFYCSCCNITTLEGSPEEVGGNFSCRQCDSLVNLKGSPESVGRDFYCRGCENLKSLEGAPEKVIGYFDCSNCNNLTSLEGVPEKIAGVFVCSYCPNLKITDSDREMYKLHEY